ncbi:putative transcriptional regulatory protein C1F7.11c [Hypsizygus marmoreus]|uniref:Transcriptional regulatory protein C1F7.11c n=1 Tax=Hypsizygus marmoreus TaxID=39966 RepID=A0A369JVB1_HYPMA|nr:putative transcriptional regulatory protein C1F7.11c [Hypsizygus marmoreus]
MVKPVSHSSSHFHSPSNTSSSAKRKKLEDEDGMSISSKKQRTRVSFSCGECHRRKQKCDRQVPCSHCVARKVPDLCKAYTPGKADQDLSVRLSRLEHIIEMALPQFCTPDTPHSSSFDINAPNGHRRSMSVGEDDTRSQTEEQDPSGGTFQSGKWYGNSASGSVAPASVIEQLQNVGMSSSDQSEPGPSRRPHDSRNFDSAQASSASHLPMTGDKSLIGEDLEPSAADNLKSLVQECGVSPHKISELLQELPPLRSSDVLIDYYFNSINWTRYPVSERDFRTAYASVSAHGRDGIGATNPNDVRFLPLLFVVLAIAVRLAPEHIAGDARSRRVTSLRYYWSSRRSLLIAAAIQPDSLDIVLTRLLSARFLTFDRRITECWSQLGAAVRTAQALGLHRDGSTMGIDPAQVEYRRRIWSYLYHADRSYALVLGRPNSIQDDYTSTKAPCNIDDEKTMTYPPESPPLSVPTPMTFVILRHQLAKIIGRIVHHFQQVRDKSSYSEVVALDDDLLKFVTRLPPHFALQPDKSLDEISKYIPVHRFLLITEILFVRISLHRPYILRRLRTDRYARSRAACFESAIKDFEVRQSFREVVPKETRESLSNAYREFQTAMISGIYLVLEPRGKDAPAMHAILDGFMKDHEGMREMDETTRRELKTIEFLQTKASQVEGRGQPPSAVDHVTNGNSEHQAQLLLSLQQSVPASSPPRPFPSLLNISTSDVQAQSPQLTYTSTGHMNQSPTFQRLQQTSQGEFANSPTGSGSPNAEEESAAQSLLDHWCNTVSNAPIDAATGGMIWGGPGGADFSGWVGTQPMAGTDPRLLNGLDGSDWNYWEALVSQIQRGP